MNNIGIFGGTFDPLHNGHIAIVNSAIEECDLTKVVFLPAKIQPFKVGKMITNEENRVNKLKLI